MPSATQLLVVRRLAEAASAHAIASGTVPPPNQDVAGWIDEWYWRATARTLSEDDRAGLEALYDVVAATDGDDAAAAAVLSAILQDPEFWTW